MALATLATETAVRIRFETRKYDSIREQVFVDVDKSNPRHDASTTGSRSSRSLLRTMVGRRCKAQC